MGETPLGVEIESLLETPVIKRFAFVFPRFVWAFGAPRVCHTLPYGISHSVSKPTSRQSSPSVSPIHAPSKKVTELTCLHPRPEAKRKKREVKKKNKGKASGKKKKRHHSHHSLSLPHLHIHQPASCQHYPVSATATHFFYSSFSLHDCLCVLLLDHRFGGRGLTQLSLPTYT